MSQLVVGIDAGATATRALVAATDGSRRGCGRAGGGNPTAHPPREAASALAAALRDALVDVDAGEVRAAVVGLAGVPGPQATEAFDAMWRGAGLRCPMRMVSDAAVAFAAGTPQPCGTVLIAGTGAIAAAVRDRDVHKTAGGHGWLLGDEGSGFWLGRQGVRAVLAHVDGHGPATALTAMVLDDLLGRSATTPGARKVGDALVGAVHAGPPVGLSRLAPLVTRAATDGDEVASRIVGAAATHLVGHVSKVHDVTDTRPIVLAGSLLTAGTAAGNSVRRRLRRRYPGRVAAAGDAAAGAAWLAALDLPDVDAATAARLHAQLVSDR